MLEKRTLRMINKATHQKQTNPPFKMNGSKVHTQTHILT